MNEKVIMGLTINELKFHNLKIYEKLLLFSIIVSPFRCYGIIVGGFNFSFFRIIGSLMILTFLIYGNFKVKTNQISRYLLTLFLICITQVVYSPSISGSVSNFFSITFGYFWCFFAYSIILQRPLLKLKVINFLILSSVLPLVLGIYQWSIYKVLGSVPSLPFQFLVATEGKTGLTYNIYARITSCFGDPAYFTTFIVPVFALCIQSLIDEVNQKKNKIIIFMQTVLILLCVIETLMAISISGIVGMASVILLVLFFNAKQKGNFKRLIFLSFVISILLSFYFYFSNYELLDILAFKTTTSSQSLSNYYGRNQYIFNALDVFLANPILGGGFGSLSLNNLTFSSAHSSLLTVLGQQGIIVFLINIYILIVMPTVFLLNAKGKIDIDYSRKTVISLFSIIVLTLGYDTLYSLDFCYTVITAALVSGLYLEKKEK